MTKKKISILTLAFFFLISTTGLPVYYHFCDMMQKKSLNECDVCVNEMEEIVFSCCSLGTFENRVTISSENTVCCQEEFVYNKVEDEFVNIKTDVNYFTSSEILLQPIVLIPHTFDFSLEVSFYCDTSPPFLINPELYISNSVLLI
ncbi:MAG: hypothetical protein IPM14_04655 [bacterium]|nr:hypothetical protein [bacterium]